MVWLEGDGACVGVGGWVLGVVLFEQERMDRRRWVKGEGRCIAYLQVLGRVDEAGVALVRVLRGRGRRELLVLARRRCVVLLQCGQLVPFIRVPLVWIGRLVSAFRPNTTNTTSGRHQAQNKSSARNIPDQHSPEPQSSGYKPSVHPAPAP